jgi:hypothetical protein
MKIILKCEQPSYDVFTGKEGPIERTVTHEFTSGTLAEALENYELFLRGLGFHFDGQLDIVTEEDVVEDNTEYQGVDGQISTQVFDQMIGSLVNNAKVEPINQAQDDEHCSRCGLSKSVMQKHTCWDKICPVHGRGQ